MNQDGSLLPRHRNNINDRIVENEEITISEIDRFIKRNAFLLINLSFLLYFFFYYSIIDIISMIFGKRRSILVHNSNF